METGHWPPDSHWSLWKSDYSATRWWEIKLQRGKNLLTIALVTSSLHGRFCLVCKRSPTARQAIVKLIKTWHKLETVKTAANDIFKKAQLLPSRQILTVVVATRTLFYHRFHQVTDSNFQHYCGRGSAAGKGWCSGLEGQCESVPGRLAGQLCWI